MLPMGALCDAAMGRHRLLAQVGALARCLSVPPATGKTVRCRREHARLNNICVVLLFCPEHQHMCHKNQGGKQTRLPSLCTQSFLRYMVVKRHACRMRWRRRCLIHTTIAYTNVDQHTPPSTNLWPKWQTSEDSEDNPSGDKMRRECRGYGGVPRSIWMCTTSRDVKTRQTKQTLFFIRAAGIPHFWVICAAFNHVSESSSLVIVPL